MARRMKIWEGVKLRSIGLLGIVRHAVLSSCASTSCIKDSVTIYYQANAVKESEQNGGVEWL